MSGISEDVWMYEKHLAENALKLTGHLPEDGQPGTRFWNMVRAHYLNDVRTTGNDHRFLSNHCHFVDYWVPREFTPPPAPMPALPPIIYIPVPPIPFLPPFVCVPAPPPINPPVTSPPSNPGNPGSPGGAVPEPPGIALAGIGLVLFWLGGKLVSHINAKRKTI